jgi:hypothetical protein
LADFVVCVHATGTPPAFQQQSRVCQSHENKAIRDRLQADDPSFDEQTLADTGPTLTRSRRRRIVEMEDRLGPPAGQSC